MNYEAFQRFERLVRIVVTGCELEVPENNVLLRGFQYLEPEKLPFGPWCWNGECGYDRIRWRRRGETESQVGLACQICVEDGIEILELTPELRRVLRPVLDRQKAAAGG
jgi:hypothetical protein